MEPEPLPEEPIVEPTPVSPITDSLRVIFRKDDGGVAVITPNVDCGMTIEELIAKDVPAGAVYRIVDVSTIPADRTFRNAWEWVD